MSKKAKRHDRDLKESILCRLESPTTDTVSSLALEYGINQSYETQVLGWS